MAIAEHLLLRFMQANPHGRHDTSWCTEAEHAEFFFELLGQCTRVGLVAQLGRALRSLSSANKRLAAMVVTHVQQLIPTLGFNTVAPW